MHKTEVKGQGHTDSSQRQFFKDILLCQSVFLWDHFQNEGHRTLVTGNKDNMTNLGFKLEKWEGGRSDAQFCESRKTQANVRILCYQHEIR